MRLSVELVATDPGQVLRYESGQVPALRALLHRHAAYEMTVVEGLGRRLVGDHSAPCGPLDLVLLGPDLPHTWSGSSGPYRIAVLQFFPAWVEQAAAALPGEGGLRALLQASKRGVFWPQAQDLAQRMYALAALDAVPRTLAFLSLLCEAAQRPWQALASDRRLHHVPSGVARERDLLQVLQRSAGPGYSQKALAARLGLSPAAFAQRVRRLTGAAPGVWIRRTRIAKACELLLSGELPISTIASQVGYGSLSQFERAFRHERGCSPAAFRRTWLSR